MTLSARRRLAALLVLAAATASCSPDSATAPGEPTAQPVLLDDVGGLFGGGLRRVTGLLSCDVAETHTTTRTIGPEGGVIAVGRHSLGIPPGALARPVEITATAPAGDRVELQFAPHGLEFRKRAALRMSYAECGAVRGLFLRIVYVDADRTTILEVLPSLPNLLRQEVYGTTDHFSSYMLAY